MTNTAGATARSLLRRATRRRVLLTCLAATFVVVGVLVWRCEALSSEVGTLRSELDAVKNDPWLRYSRQDYVNALGAFTSRRENELMAWEWLGTSPQGEPQTVSGLLQTMQEWTQDLNAFPSCPSFVQDLQDEYYDALANLYMTVQFIERDPSSGDGWVRVTEASQAEWTAFAAWSDAFE